MWNNKAVKEETPCNDPVGSVKAEPAPGPTHYSESGWPRGDYNVTGRGTNDQVSS